MNIKQYKHSENAEFIMTLRVRVLNLKKYIHSIIKGKHY